jgi:putative transposase
VAEYTKEVFRRIGEGYGFVIDTMDVEEDHVQIFLKALPKYSPAWVAEILRSISGREIFHRFPWLRQQLWGGELWGDGYFVRTVGEQVTTDIIRRYINYQREQAGQLKL